MIVQNDTPSAQTHLTRIGKVDRQKSKSKKGENLQGGMGTLESKRKIKRARGNYFRTMKQLQHSRVTSDSKSRCENVHTKGELYNGSSRVKKRRTAAN